MTPTQWSKVVQIEDPVWENKSEGFIVIELTPTLARGEDELPESFFEMREVQKLVLIPPGVSVQCVMAQDGINGELHLYGPTGEHIQFILSDGQEGVDKLRSMFAAEPDMIEQFPLPN
jgi:hypothetical protein